MERTKSFESMRNLSNLKNNTTAMPIIAAAAGHIIWGFSFLFAKVAMQSAEAPVYLSIRFILALFLLTMMVVCGREKLTFRGKNWTPMILLCIAEPLYFYFESYGIYYTNATFAGVILAVVPVVSMVVAAIFLKEYPSRRKALFSIVPVIGVIVMTIAGEELGIIRPIGVVLLIVASQYFNWPGAIHPGGVMLCILLFNQPVDSYVTYSLDRILDTAVGVVVGLLINVLLPRYRIERWIHWLLGEQYEIPEEAKEAKL